MRNWRYKQHFDKRITQRVPYRIHHSPVEMYRMHHSPVETVALLMVGPGRVPSIDQGRVPSMSQSQPLGIESVSRVIHQWSTVTSELSEHRRLSRDYAADVLPVPMVHSVGKSESQVSSLKSQDADDG
jgi:hypothetical protein